MVQIVERNVLSQAVMLDDAKNYLKVSNNNDDVLIMDLIEAAYEIFEQYTLIAPVLTMYKCKAYSKTGREPIPRFPVVNVSGVEMDKHTLIVPAEVEVEFMLVAGYEITPAAIKEAILKVVAELYYKRDAEQSFSFLRRFRMWEI